jgi:hypothetical protein
LENGSLKIRNREKEYRGERKEERVEIQNTKLELRIYSKRHAVPIAIGIVSTSF